MPERIVYADCAATKPVSKRALAAAMPYLTEEFGNPSSVYGAGLRAARALLDARRVITSLLGADVRELIFTSGGTEADALAITGAAQLGAAAGKKHIITSAAEYAELCISTEKSADITRNSAVILDRIFCFTVIFITVFFVGCRRKNLLYYL